MARACDIRRRGDGQGYRCIAISYPEARRMSLLKHTDLQYCMTTYRRDRRRCFVSVSENSLRSALLRLASCRWRVVEESCVPTVVPRSQSIRSSMKFGNPTDGTDGNESERVRVSSPVLLLRLSTTLAQHARATPAQGRHISTVGYIRQHIPNRIESQSVRWVLGNVSRKTRTRRDTRRADATPANHSSEFYLL